MLKVVWNVRPWERWTFGVLAVFAIMAGVVVAIAWREAHADPVVVNHILEVPGLRHQVKIAFLSDTHVNEDALASSVDMRRLERTVEKVNDLDADIVVLGGDYLATAHRRGDVPFAEAVAPFARLRSRMGVFSVIGNHDCQEPENTTDTMSKALLAARTVPLVNRSVRAGPIQIVGLDDLWCGESDISAASRALEDAEGRPVVLVSHNPDVFPQVPAPIALTLAGHTHAAQIVPPVVGPIVSVSRYGQRYRYGMIVENGRRMIVSAGLGGLPLRWNAAPEIVLVTLRPTGGGVPTER